jgi:hypothetical protein
MVCTPGCGIKTNFNSLVDGYLQVGRLLGEWLALLPTQPLYEDRIAEGGFEKVEKWIGIWFTARK